MSIYQDLLDGNAKLSLVGLGYVGMPIAVEFAKHVKVCLLYTSDAADEL